MKEIILLILLYLPFSAMGKTDTTYYANHYMDAAPIAVYVWSTEDGKLQKISAYDSSMTMIYELDIPGRTFVTYNCIMGPVPDDVLHGYVNLHTYKLYEVERAAYMNQVSTYDSISRYLISIGALGDYRQISYLTDDKGNRFRNEITYKGLKPVKYKHYYNDKKIFSASLNSKGFGIGIAYKYLYNQSFDILILSDGGRYSDDKTSILYILLPALFFFLLYFAFGFLCSKSGYYKEIFITSTIMVFVFPFFIFAASGSSLQGENYGRIIGWFYLGVFIVPLILSFYNLIKKQGSKLLVVWSVIYLFLMVIASWLVYELGQISWKVGG